MEVSTQNQDSLVLNATFPRESWFGFGFGPHMAGNNELVLLIAP